MKNYCFLLLFYLISNSIVGQIVKGKVFDSSTKEPIPFVSIFNKNTLKGVTSNELGEFAISIDKDDNELEVRSLGYFIKVVSASNIQSIFLEPKENQLNEIFVRSTNPAHIVIVNAIKNKLRNDPEQYPFFQYKVYHKSIVSANSEAKDSNTKISKVLSNNDLYINESVGHRKFLKPNLTKEIVEGSKTSGSKSTLFTSLTPLMQQFGFYKDIISFQSRSLQQMVNLVSPLSVNSVKSYDFTLVETKVNKGGDSTFIIEFEPKPKSNIDGLKGVLHLHSGDYAIQYVEAEPANEGSLHFKLEQYYEQVSGSERWFPVDLSIEWKLSEFKINGIGVLFNIKTIISEIDLQSAISPLEFDHNVFTIKQDATFKTEEFWKENRGDSLSIREKSTYDFQNKLSFTKKIRQNLVLNASEWYTSGIIPISKKLDLSLQNLFDANVYEGFRPTINILTNENFSTFLRLDGKLGYGFTDKALKYEGRLRFNLIEKYSAKLNLSYRNDISEPANVQFFIWNAPQIPYELLRTFQIARADSLELWKGEISFRALKHGTITIGATDEKRNPTYAYKFHNPIHDPKDEMSDRFHTQEISLGIRYAFGEQCSQIGRGSILTKTPSPTIAINLINGQLIFPEGKIGYTKLNAKIEFDIKMPRLGETFINLSLGKIWGQVPYPYLYNGRGAKADQGNLIWVANHFNTMGLYEFTSDKYANLFFNHSFGQLLFKPKSKWFQPDVSLFQGIAVGSLSNKQDHRLVQIKTLEKGFFESGLLIDNIYRQKFLKLFHVGAGIGVFNRWGANKFNEKSDNWAYRLVWNIKF
jgi:Family of unknown function (DUF5686)/CarboxypepD_reg-like domain